MNIGVIPSSWSGPILSVLRIMTGLLFFAHGSTKILGFPSTQYFPEAISPFSFMGFAGILADAWGL